MVEQSKKFVCIQVDCDDDKDTPEKYHVEGYPTVLFLRSNGEVIEELGSRDADEMAAQFERIAKDYEEK